MLSYSAITNRGKITLPSVDSWGTNMSIMKDPPKSITLRRKDKVGDNNDIIQMIDDSDRSNDSIMRFARGVNPSVSVSYSNNGGSLQNYGNQQAFLPYSINKDGDFHPFVHAPQDLLPLSRLPRNTVKVISNPALPHFTKELDNSRNQTVTSTVKQNIISSQVKTAKVYSLQKPFQEPFEVKYNIQDVLQKSGNTAKVSFSDRTNQNVIKPTNSINDDLMQKSAISNKQNIQQKNTSDFDPSRFLQESITNEVHSNKMSKGNNEHLIDKYNIKLQDTTNIDYQSAKKGNEQIKYIHENFELEKNLPYYTSSTNKTSLGNIQYMNENELELSRTLPQYEQRTNTKSFGSTKYINEEKKLERNVPIYHSKTNNQGTKHTIYIHNDVELDRVLPEHSAFTNITKNIQKTLGHEYMKEYERKAVLGELQTNDSKKGEHNISSTTVNLNEKMQIGEYNGRGTIPVIERLQGMNYNMNSDKSKLMKNTHNTYKERV